MGAFQLHWEHAPAWLLACLALALLLSLAVYGRTQAFSSFTRYGLFALRTLWIFLLLALLLNPLLQRFKESVLPPVSVILVDNSRSVQLGTSPDSLTFLQASVQSLKKEWEAQGQRVVLTSLGGDLPPDSAWKFDRPESALETALRRIREEFQNQNLHQVFLISDGIENEGKSLQDARLPFPVHSIRVGNPASRKDLSIQEIRLNSVAFLGNTFPVSVLVRGKKIPPGPLKLSVSEGQNLLETKSFTLSGSGLANIDFSIRPASKGLKQLTFRLENLEGEVTWENNRRTAFIEVMESRKKVLLLASVPHPDIKAFRSALSEMNQVELVTRVGGLETQVPEEKWDLVILHQLPDRMGTFGAQVQRALEGKSSGVWLFASPLTDFGRLQNLASSWIRLENSSMGSDEIQARWEPAFQGFEMEDKDKKVLEDLPPLRSPSPSYSWKVPAEPILQQRLGRVTTPTALLSRQTDGMAQRAIFWGEGLWLWRLNNFARQENTVAVDGLIQKTIQLLLAPETKNRLNVFLSSPELEEGEAARFRFETYNPVFEPIFDQKITLEITDRSGKQAPKTYSFVNARGIPDFASGPLQPGIYRAKASALLNGKSETDVLEFVVRPQELEARELEANHTILKELSAKTKGFSSGIHDFVTKAKGLEKARAQVEFSDWNESILGEIWILILLLVLAGLEWFIRKANGSL